MGNQIDDFTIEKLVRTVSRAAHRYIGVGSVNPIRVNAGMGISAIVSIQHERDTPCGVATRTAVSF